MAKSRDKPILFEVFSPPRPRPDALNRPPRPNGNSGSPAPDAQSSDHAPPRAAASASRLPSSNPAEPFAPTARQWLQVLTLRGPALLAVLASAIVLITAAFYIGRAFAPAPATGSVPDDPIASALREAPNPAVLEVPESQRRGGGRIAVPPRPEERAPSSQPDQPQRNSPRPPSGPTPAAGRLKGWTYLVIQHFPRSRESDAVAAAEYLRENNIACEVETLTREVRLVSTEGFLIDQKDAAASQQARQRCDELKKRVLAAGKQYARTGKYAFEMCYAQKF